VEVVVVVKDLAAVDVAVVAVVAVDVAVVDSAVEDSAMVAVDVVVGLQLWFPHRNKRDFS
jgi:hypothetical protein